MVYSFYCDIKSCSEQQCVRGCTQGTYVNVKVLTLHCGIFQADSDTQLCNGNSSAYVAYIRYIELNVKLSHFKHCVLQVL